MVKYRNIRSKEKTGGDGRNMKFMHMADVHLGAAPDYGYPWAKERGAELWESFRRCIEDAQEQAVDLVLIAGDLFHRQPEQAELDEVNDLFASLGDTIIVLIAGDSDYLQLDSPYLSYPWSSNVICLFSEQVERIRIPKLKTEIYGMSYRRKEITEPVFDELQAEDDEYFKILLAHGGDDKHIPISRERLKDSGFDYAALGHLYRPQVYIRNLAVYAGSPEPFESSDFEGHGYILGEVNRKKVRLTFCETCVRQYRKENIEVKETDTPVSIRHRIEETVQNGGIQNIYRIILTGCRAPGLHPNVSSYLDCGRILSVEDRTAPAFHMEELRRKYRGGLIERYISSFGDKPLNSVEEKALRCGLEALLDTEGGEHGDGI